MNAEGNHFFTFLKYLFLELLNHKWFKAVFLALLTLWFVDNRLYILSFFEDYKSISWAVLLLIYWIRFFIPEVLPKSSFNDFSIQKLNRAQLFSGKGVNIVGLSGSNFEGAGYHVVWEFEKELRATPTISIANYNMKLSPSNIEYEPFIELYEDIPLNTKKCTFKMKIRLKSNLGNPVSIENVDDLIKEVEIFADARPFKFDSNYSKIIDFFSTKLRSNKYIGWLC